MSDIGTPSDPPPIEPTSAQWWRERMTDLGFWGTVVIVFLVVVVIFGQIAGSSGTTGTLVATLLLIGFVALVALGVLAIVRHRLTREDDDDERGRPERAA